MLGAKLSRRCASHFAGVLRETTLACRRARLRAVLHHRQPNRNSVSSVCSARGLRPLQWTGDARQVQALETLRVRLLQQGHSVPTEVLTWYLRDRYFNPHEAEEKLLKTINWRKSFLPSGVSYQAVARELTTGKAYIHSHPDIHGRPVLVIRANRHVIGQFPLDSSKRLCVYLIEEALRQLPPGQEQLIGVFDLHSFGLRNADVLFAQFMIEAFFEYYPRRVGEVLFVDAPWVFQPLYETIRPLLRKYSALVTFLSREQLRHQYFTSSTVPADFQ